MILIIFVQEEKASLLYRTQEGRRKREVNKFVHCSIDKLHLKQGILCYMLLKILGIYFLYAICIGLYKHWLFFLLRMKEDV